jgi:hypothetical protein
MMDWLILSFGVVVAFAEDGAAHAHTRREVPNLFVEQILPIRSHPTCPCSARTPTLQVRASNTVTASAHTAG